jgi:ABC-type Fe2+-enterobactin transport system substrate-binding protein
MLVSETMAHLVTGTGATETIPSSVASTDPTTTGTLQAQVTETVALAATTSSAIAPELQLADPHTEQIQTVSLSRAPTEGQHDSSESEEDTS